MPCPAMMRPRARPAPSSSWADMSQPPECTTAACAPSFARPPAASSPSRPPPATTTRAGRPCASARSRTSVTSASTSSIVRYTRAWSPPGDVGHRRARSRGEHEVVPWQHQAAGGRRGAGVAVDRDDALAGEQPHAALVPHRGRRQGQVGRDIRQPRAQGDPVIRRVGLFADDRDPQGAAVVAGVQAVGEAVGGGSAADDDDVAHCRIRCAWCGSLRPSVARLVASVGPGRFRPCYADVTASHVERTSCRAVV